MRVIVVFLVLLLIIYVMITINIHQIHNFPTLVQKDVYWCGPAVMSAVLKYWKVNLSQSEIASKIYNPSINLTTVKDMVDYARSLNFEVINGASNITFIEGWIEKDIPVIVLQWFDLGRSYKHYRVVIGFNRLGRILYVFDPWNGSIIKIKYEDFASLWKLEVIVNETIIIFPRS